jgi:hypothetical protein
MEALDLYFGISHGKKNQEGGWNDDQFETGLLFFYHGIESKEDKCHEPIIFVSTKMK